MEDTGIIDRRRLEGDREGLVFIVTLQPDGAGTGLFVDHFIHVAFDLFEVSDIEDLKSMNDIVYLHSFIFSNKMIIAR